jgi:D-3-phosphoglycerate dehydrogenase
LGFSSTEKALLLNRPIVLLTQPIIESALARIRAIADVRIASDRPGQALSEQIRDAEVLVVRDPIPASVIAAGQRLRLVARHGVGLDYIPVEECRRRGILVTITPGANTNAVVEWVVGSMIALSHRMGTAMRFTRHGEWKKREGLEGFELSGKTLGIVGFGRIGSALSPLVSVAFKMNVLAFDPQRSALEIANHGAKATDLDELLGASHFVSLHLPATDATKHIINAQSLTRMRRGSILINGARGALVDTDALFSALTIGQLAGVAMDGVDAEPLPTNHPLLLRDDVILTPHSAALTREALYNMGHMVADEVERVLHAKAPLNTVV